MPICLTAGPNETPRFYLINQTLGGPFVRVLRVRAGILLLITQRILPEGGCEVWDRPMYPGDSCLHELEGTARRYMANWRI